MSEKWKAAYHTPLSDRYPAATIWVGAENIGDILMEKKDVQRIIRCVNTHDDMLEALENALSLLTHIERTKADWMLKEQIHGESQRIMAAIAKAKGETDG